MASTDRTTTSPGVLEHAATLTWQSWPLAEHLRWSWLVVVGILAISGIVLYLGGSWLLAAAVVAGAIATLWQFFLPVKYEIASLGLRRNALGRTRLVPWHAIRAYQLRPTGVVFYQRSDPTKVDLLRSLFVPYASDADEMLCAIRDHLPHAVEVPQ
jgi:hypothetical protein